MNTTNDDEEDSYAAAKNSDRLKRLEAINEQLDHLNDQQVELSSKWNKEKGKVDKIKAVREELADAKLEIEKAERDYELNRASEIKYSVLPPLEEKLAKLTKKQLGRNTACFATKYVKTTLARFSAPGRVFLKRNCRQLNVIVWFTLPTSSRKRWLDKTKPSRLLLMLFSDRVLDSTIRPNQLPLSCSWVLLESARHFLQRNWQTSCLIRKTP